MNPLTKAEKQNLKQWANTQFGIALRYKPTDPVRSEFYRGRSVAAGKIATQYNPRMRDTQRSKVYAWENTLPKQTLTLEQSKNLVAKACRRYSKAIPYIANGRGTRIAYGSLSRINLPVWARTDVTVLHEVAHAINRKYQPGSSWHGPEFMRFFINLLDWNKTNTTSNLLKSAKKFGIKVASGTKVPRKIDYRIQLINSVEVIIEKYSRLYGVSQREIRKIIKQKLNPLVK